MAIDEGDDTLHGEGGEDRLYGGAGDDHLSGGDGSRLPRRRPTDYDSDASTPDRLDPRHPYDFTENGLRDEIGAPRAPEY